METGREGRTRERIVENSMMSLTIFGIAGAIFPILFALFLTCAVSGNLAQEEKIPEMKVTTS